MGDALDLVSGSRNKFVFVHNNFLGGEIEQVINNVTQVITNTGIRTQISVVGQEVELFEICRSSIRGTSACIAAAVFHSSPTEGPGGNWNYTLRADDALERKVDVNSKNNDAQIYAIPFQHAVDMAISQTSVTTGGSVLTSNAFEYPYTSLSQEERETQIRVHFMSTVINILAVAFFIGMVGVIYHLTGMMVGERETGLSSLLDCMMPNLKRWQPQWVRLLSFHLAFDIVYLPGWLVIAVILKVSIFVNTSIGVLFLFQILAGLSLASMSLLFAVCFHRAQLSGIVSVLVAIILAVLAQAINTSGTAIVAILSLLFPPMTYTFFIIIVAQWERQDEATNLIQAAPENASEVPGIALLFFMLVQAVVYPFIATWVERRIHGTASNNRTVTRSKSVAAVSVTNFSKVYQPSGVSRLLGKLGGAHRQPVLAVNKLSFSALRGQILVLLGANGSGKSTTLEAVAGLAKITSGNIHVNYDRSSGAFGLCPQKNVMWDLLTVEEHVRIMNKLKSTESVDSIAEIRQLIAACDLGHKRGSWSRTLSGGQKRKLQLAMMFTGGSNVCCIDEISSGLDPISRRKIWDILLAERGARSIILTTHFLDEADLLADQIAILSKGVLQAAGTSVELKQELGSGYRVLIYNTSGIPPRRYHGIKSEVQYDQTVYKLKDSAEASKFVEQLEKDGIYDYQVNGPTIEDVFLKVAEEVRTSAPGPNMVLNRRKSSGLTISTYMKEDNAPLELLSGQKISIPMQALVLFRKRFIVLRRNPVPQIAAFLVPVVAAGLVTLFLRHFNKLGCSIEGTTDFSPIQSLASQKKLHLVIGPRSAVPDSTIQLFQSTLWGGGTIGSGQILPQSIHFVDSVDEFNDYMAYNYANVTPGGLFAGTATVPPFFVWKGDGYDWRGRGEVYLATVMQNFLDVVLTQIPISHQYVSFDSPWSPDFGKVLQLMVYFGLACAVYPAFFALYPTIERIRHVRALHYSNGVRPLPLWTAYLAFDFIVILFVSVLATVIFAASADVWYHIAYLFVTLLFYGIASALLSYIISLFARSQLSAFALAAGGQSTMFLLYFLAYIGILTYSPTEKIDAYILVAAFTIGSISPTANLARAMYIALNVFSLDCKGRVLQTNPTLLKIYGQPILYLVLQCVFLFSLLLWLEGGSMVPKFRSKTTVNDVEKKHGSSRFADDMSRPGSLARGLRVDHLTKEFKGNLAVDDVSFQATPGEVYALLGPNGAGKSTTISLVRGDLRPTSGDVFVENISVTKNLVEARQQLGVCPQFDAMDVMTVREHLEFYASIRGVSRPSHNVAEVIRAVGLQSYANRMAHALSGGNKRKLSLGIALMGNPSVLLLDEPSSGMDAASKRIMWRTLASVVPGRSLVLTTHSMEEAGALASRAGIMAGRMLASGTTDDLRRQHGNAYHVHLVHSDAPDTSRQDMLRMRNWVLEHFPSADVETKPYHGQLRFSVPIDSLVTSQTSRTIIAENTATQPFSQAEGEGGDADPLPETRQSTMLSNPATEPPKTPVFSRTSTFSERSSAISPITASISRIGFPSPSKETPPLPPLPPSLPESLSSSSRLPRSTLESWIARARNSSTAIGPRLTTRDRYNDAGPAAINQPDGGSSSNRPSIAALFGALENAKDELGFEYYSVSETTLDQVFLAIVGKYQVSGEDDKGMRD